MSTLSTPPPTGLYCSYRSTVMHGYAIEQSTISWLCIFRSDLKIDSEPCLTLVFLENAILSSLRVTLTLHGNAPYPYVSFADTWQLSGSILDLLSQVPGKRAASSHSMEDLSDSIVSDRYFCGGSLFIDSVSYGDIWMFCIFSQESVHSSHPRCSVFGKTRVRFIRNLARWHLESWISSAVSLCWPPLVATSTQLLQ